MELRVRSHCERGLGVEAERAIMFYGTVEKHEKRENSCEGN